MIIDFYFTRFQCSGKAQSNWWSHRYIGYWEGSIRKYKNVFLGFFPIVDFPFNCTNNLLCIQQWKISSFSQDTYPFTTWSNCREWWLAWMLHFKQKKYRNKMKCYFVAVIFQTRMCNWKLSLQFFRFYIIKNPWT